jgi:maleate isomerase
MEDKPCDWRARIGVLSPACCPNQVCEWKGNLPDGVTFHEAIMGMVENNPAGLLSLKEKAMVEGRKLADGLMDIILFACTSGSFIGGPGYDRTIIEELEAATGIKATTTSTCVSAVFAELGIKKMALLGPYIQEVMETEVAFFKQQGIETLYVKGLGYRANLDFTRLHFQPSLFYPLAQEAYRAVPDIDCIFITCMASPSKAVINVLEQETGKIVVSSQSASLYSILKQLGIRAELPYYGRLGKMLADNSTE